MSNRLYIGNLSFNVGDDDLGKIFGESGEIVSANVIRDYNSGRSKGFAFVEFKNSEDADKAIKNFDGKEVDGRAIRVSIAREKQNNNSRGGGGFSNRNRY